MLNGSRLKGLLKYNSLLGGDFPVEVQCLSTCNIEIEELMAVADAKHSRTQSQIDKVFAHLICKKAAAMVQSFTSAISLSRVSLNKITHSTILE